MTSPIGLVVRRTTRPNATKPMMSRIGKSRNHGPPRRPSWSPPPNVAPNQPATNTNRKNSPTPIAIRRTNRLRIAPQPSAERGGKGSSDGHHGGRPPGPRRRSCIGEPVADAMDSDDVPRGTGRGLDLPADVLHVRIDRALVGLDRDAVYGVEQLGAGEHTTGLAREGHEELKLGRREVDLGAPDVHPHLGRVDLDVAGAHDLVAAGRGARATEHRPDARDELLRAERLDDVVVRADLESHDPVGLVTSSGE